MSAGLALPAASTYNRSQPTNPSDSQTMTQKSEANQPEANQNDPFAADGPEHEAEIAAQAQAQKAQQAYAKPGEAAAGAVDPADETLIDTALAVDATEEIAVLNGQIDDLRDRLMRAVAETENVRRRAERDKVDAGKFALARFAGDMLAVSDNFSRALKAVPKDALDGADDRLRNLFTGIDAIERELLNIFSRHGIKRIEIAENQIFDPNLHEVMFEVEDRAKPRGTIMQVLEDGYMLHERLLRPARVGVATGGSEGPVDSTA